MIHFGVWFCLKLDNTPVWGGNIICCSVRACCSDESGGAGTPSPWWTHLRSVRGSSDTGERQGCLLLVSIQLYLHYCCEVPATRLLKSLWSAETLSVIQRGDVISSETGSQGGIYQAAPPHFERADSVYLTARLSRTGQSVPGICVMLGAGHFKCMTSLMRSRSAGWRHQNRWSVSTVERESTFWTCISPRCEFSEHGFGAYRWR